MSGEYHLKDGCLSEFFVRRFFKSNIVPKKKKVKYTGSRKALRELKKARGEE